MDEEILKPCLFVGPSRREVREFPEPVQDDIGFALFQAQQGKVSRAAKPLKGFGGRGVLEVVENHDGNTYRAVYTVRFAGVIYVLHAFQKKSKKGIKTPPQNMAVIKVRLKAAQDDYQRREEGE